MPRSVSANPSRRRTWPPLIFHASTPFTWVELERNEIQRIELARRAEQHAALVRGAARGGVRGPRGVAQCDVERGGIRRLVLLPARHRVGEPELRERLAQRGLQVAPQRRPVERRGRLGTVCVHRLALDEKALDGVERRQLVVPRLERAHVGLDPEQRRDEVLEVRAQRDQQLGLRLARERVGAAARRVQARGERGVSGLQDGRRTGDRRARAPSIE